MAICSSQVPQAEPQDHARPGQRLTASAMAGLTFPSAILKRAVHKGISEISTVIGARYTQKRKRKITLSYKRWSLDESFPGYGPRVLTGTGQLVPKL